jgi:hypothetical protein
VPQSSIERFGIALDAAVAWIRRYNGRVDASRLNQYRRTVEEIVGDPTKQARSDDPTFKRALEALLAGGELHFIHKYLASSDDPALRQKISDFAKGPYFQNDEDPTRSTNLARNTGFELYFAAQLMRAGYQVDVGRNADIEIVDPKVYIECKRPQTSGKIQANLCKARQQLLGGRLQMDAPKVIALSVGKVLGGERELIYHGTPEELDEAIDADLRRFRKRFEPVWHDPSYAHISAIWLHYVRVVVLTNPIAFARRAYDRVIVLQANATTEQRQLIEAVGGAVTASDQIEEF